MKQKFSAKWKASKQPRKQRKYKANAPLNIKRKFLSTLLSKELRKKYEKRNIVLRKGDKVKVLRGNFRKTLGKVAGTDVKKSRVFVESVEHVKKDGSKSYYPLNASNLMIMELNLDDKRRKKNLEKAVKKGDKNGK